MLIFLIRLFLPNNPPSISKVESLSSNAWIQLDSPIWEKPICKFCTTNYTVGYGGLFMRHADTFFSLLITNFFFIFMARLAFEIWRKKPT